MKRGGGDDHRFGFVLSEWGVDDACHLALPDVFCEEFLFGICGIGIRGICNGWLLRAVVYGGGF